MSIDGPMNHLQETSSVGMTDMHHRFFAEFQGLAEVGSFDWNVRTNELRWSKELYRIYGVDPETRMTLDGFISRIHPDDRERVHVGIAEAMSGSGRLHQEERILRSDGEVRLLESLGTVIRDEAGHPTHFIGVCRDITDQRNTELALQWQLDGLELLAVTSNELLAHSKTPKEWNSFLDQFTKHMGCEVHALWCWEDQETNILSFGGEPRDLADRVANSAPIVHFMMFQPEPWTYQVFGQEELKSISGNDGIARELKSLVKIPFVKEGKVIGVLAFGSTERTSFSKSEMNFAYAIRDLLRSAKIRIYADEERRVSEERYRLITENAKMIIWEKWPNSSDFNYVNGSCEELLGYPIEKWMEEGFWESRLHPDDRRFAMESWQRIAKDRRGERIEYRMIGKDGRVVWVDDVTTIVHDRDGNMIGRRGSLQDITDRKNLENRHVQSQKMEAIGNLAGGIAHDFNNLLAVILSNLEIASMNPNLASGAVEAAKNATQSAAGIVRHLLRFSKKSKLELQPISCNAIVYSAIALLKHALDSTIHIDLRLNEELPMICADQAGMEQVIVNLCLNARDAMPTGGSILIKTEKRLDDENNAWILLSVSDEGVGMSSEVRNRIFEPFFTTKEMEHGTGLGLSTCYAIVKQHDGNIECTSQEGVGTEFRVWLPTAKDCVVPEKGDANDRKETTTTQSGSILVVDDEEVVLQATSSLLKCMGYSTLEAKSGDEALRILNTPELHSQVQLVLLDLTMPHRNGKEILQCIKQSFPKLPVLICSGYVCGDVDFEGLVQPDGFVNKPFSLQQLRESLKNALPDAAKHQVLR